MALPIGQILGIGKTLVEKIFPDKEKQNEALQRMEELRQKGELDLLQTEMSVMLAEANSKDAWTSRARPSFMYVMYALMLFSIPVAILSLFVPDAATKIGEAMKAYLGAIPAEMWATFAVGYTGYNIARSVDKKKLEKTKKGLNL
jgi:hypothetical protein